jgi:hypothetical protein
VKRYLILMFFALLVESLKDVTFIFILGFHRLNETLYLVPLVDVQPFLIRMFVSKMNNSREDQFLLLSCDDTHVRGVVDLFYVACSSIFTYSHTAASEKNNIIKILTLLNNIEYFYIKLYASTGYIYICTVRTHYD